MLATWPSIITIAPVGRIDKDMSFSIRLGGSVRNRISNQLKSGVNQP
jgi:hypothetical protein